MLPKSAPVTPAPVKFAPVSVLEFRLALMRKALVRFALVSLLEFKLAL